MDRVRAGFRKEIVKQRLRGTKTEDERKQYFYTMTQFYHYHFPVYRRNIDVSYGA